MEEKIINMNQFLGAAQGDQEHMLGKFLYFSLANLLVDKDELSSLCESMGIPYTGSTRLSLGDAFRSATGDIRERVPVTVDGETNIYLAYCRDNKRTAGVFSRELVKETLNRETNRYEKLANISCGIGIYRLYLPNKQADVLYSSIPRNALRLRLEPPPSNVEAVWDNGDVLFFARYEELLNTSSGYAPETMGEDECIGMLELDEKLYSAQAHYINALTGDYREMP